LPTVATHTAKSELAGASLYDSNSEHLATVTYSRKPKSQWASASSVVFNGFSDVEAI